MSDDFEKCLQECIDKNTKILSRLGDLKVEMTEYHKNCNTVKTVGTVTSATGTGILVASVLAAPFTGGLSLAGTLGGLALSVGGGATNVVTDVVDSVKTKEIIKLIQELVESKQKLNKKLQDHFDSINDMKQQLVKNDIPHDDALLTIFRGIANGSGDWIRRGNGPGDIIPDAYIRMFTTLARLHRAEDLILKAGNVGLKGIEMAAPKAMSALGLSGKLGSGMAKTMGKFAVVFSVAMTVVDIALLIKDWASDHPTIKVIDEVIDKISEENQSLKETKELIDELKDRVYYTVVEELPIVGQNDSFNQVVVHLLNNEAIKCEEILRGFGIDYSFRDLQIPEKIAHLLAKEAGATVNFDQKECEVIVKKRGKSAAKAVRALVKEVLKKLEEYKKKGPDNKKRSVRGEHVINNKVIWVYREIIEKFVRQTFNCSFTELTRIPAESVVYQDFHKPLPQRTVNNIQEVMVAKIPTDVWYINANAVIYGIVIFILRESAKLHMVGLYNLDDTRSAGTDHSTKIRSTVYLLNQLRIYVDEVALQYWLTCDGGDVLTFEDSRSSVQAMLQNLYEHMRVWVQEIKQYYP